VPDEKTETLLGIGELVERLRAECPEISLSMVRFWEREGLIAPARTEGGHRKYAERDLERLRAIVQLRHRRYLPLAAVKRILREREADPTSDLRLFDELFRPTEYDPNFQPLTRAEAAKRTGLTVEQIRTFEQLRFLPSESEAASRRRFDEDDLRILQLLGELLKAGLAPEDLAFYSQDIRAHVAHEFQLLDRVTGGCEGPPERRAAFRQVQQCAGQLRALLYRRCVRQAAAERM
jgi:DNA-binding transcriptional MerR regulator